MAQQGRRRIDRVAASDFLDGLEDRSTAEIRTMRDECRQEEERLSFERRLLQGRVDIVRAERARRQSGDGEGLVDALPSILADDTSSRSGSPQARVAPVFTPDPDPTYTRREADRTEWSFGNLPELGDRELAELHERLASDERAVSDLRRRVIDHLDRLQSEVAARLTDGSLVADDILRASGWASGTDQQ
ncbi:MAG: hypothetical protein WD080_08100 [Egibacteraceae bacterium]